MCMQFLYNQVARLRASSFHTGQKCLIAIFPTALEGVHTCKPVGFSHSTLPRTDSQQNTENSGAFVSCAPNVPKTSKQFMPFIEISNLCAGQSRVFPYALYLCSRLRQNYIVLLDLNTMVCLYGQVTEFVSRPTIFLSILILLITTTKENSYYELLAKRFTTLYILCSFITLITAVYMHMNSNKMFNKKIHFCLSDKYLQHIQTNTNML